MLIRLTPEQVSAFWDVIKYSVEESFPPTVEMGMDEINIVLENLLNGKADCWISCRREDTNKIEGVVVTKVVIDDFTHTRNLMIYSIYAYADTINETWQSGMITIARWAKKHKCHKIIGFTSEPMIIRRVNSLGGDTSLTLVSLNPDDFLSEEE